MSGAGHGSQQTGGGGVSPQAGSSQSGQPVNPQAGTASSGADSSVNPQAGSGDGADSPETLTPEVAAEIRRENQKLRERLRAQEQAKAQADAETRARELAAADAEKLRGELSKLQQQLDEQRKAAQRQAVQWSVEKVAQRLGVVDVDAAVKLLDWEALTYTSEGLPENAEALLKSLLKARPWLARPGAGSADAGAGRAPTSGSGAGAGGVASNADMNAQIRRIWRGS